MTPFQTFRLWVRRGRSEERIATALAAALAFALLIWLAIPGGSSASEGQGSSDSLSTEVTRTAPGQATPSGANSGQPTTVGGTAPSTTVRGGTTAVGSPGTSATGTGPYAGVPVGSVPGVTGGKPGCVSPPGTAPGVTASTIKVAVALTNIFGPAANSQFGVPPVADQQAYYQASVDAINASGGIACRKLVVEYYAINPADSSDTKAKCLEVAKAAPLALLDGGGAAGQAGQGAPCYAQEHIPFIGGLNYLTDSMLAQYYPYLFSLLTYDRLDHNTYFALADRGFFSKANGFGKLGLLHGSCDPNSGSNAKKWLVQAGVAASDIVAYDFGCPGAAPLSDLQQAVITFQRMGVTHVTMAEFSGGIYYFNKFAEQQQYRPKYGLPDENLIATAYGGTLQPDPNNMDGAIVISGGAFGEEHTPGAKRSAATLKCDAVHKKAGQPTSWEQELVGVTCVQLAMLKAAVENAPKIARTALAQGLAAAKSVDFSYPMGPNDFSLSHGTAGGQYWRATQYFKSCSCFRTTESAYHPSYPYR